MVIVCVCTIPYLILSATGAELTQEPIGGDDGFIQPWANFTSRLILISIYF